MKEEKKALLEEKAKRDKNKLSLNIFDDHIRNMNLMNKNLFSSEKFSQRNQEGITNQSTFICNNRDPKITKNSKNKTFLNLKNNSDLKSKSDNDGDSNNDSKNIKENNGIVKDENNISNGISVYRNRIINEEILNKNSFVATNFNNNYANNNKKSKNLILNDKNNKNNKKDLDELSKSNNERSINKNDNQNLHKRKNSDFLIYFNSKEINNIKLLLDNIDKNTQNCNNNTNLDKNRNDKYNSNDKNKNKNNLVSKNKSSNYFTDFSNLMNLKTPKKNLENERKINEGISRDPNLLELKDFESERNSQQNFPYLKQEEELQQAKEEDLEWFEMLRSSNLTIKEYAGYANNKHLIKLFDLIDCLKKAISEKNFYLKLLSEENNDLNNNNNQLHNENSILIKRNIGISKNADTNVIGLSESYVSNSFLLTEKEQAEDISIENSLVCFNLKIKKKIKKQTKN